MQFLKWPLKGGFQKEKISIRTHIKMPEFTAEINIFTALFLQGVNFYI